MASDPKLVVALEARLNKFEKDLKSAGLIADREVKNIEDKFSKSNPKFGPGFLGGFLGGALGALSIDKIAKSLLDVFSSMAKIGDQSERVGVTAEQLQELQFALEQSGGSASQAGPALEKFANTIAKASEGEGKLARFLEENNIKLKDRNGVLRPTAQLLGEVANLIQGAATPQERLNIAVEFFGRAAGPAMATALANGSSGLQAFGAQAQNAGAIIEESLIKKAKEIDDKWNLLSRTWSVTAKSAILSLIEAADRFSKQSSIAAALDAGTESAKELSEAIAFARSKGSPVDPSWIKELERLQELERESNRFRQIAADAKGSTLPNVTSSGKPTNTAALHTREDSGDSQDGFDRAIAQAEKHTLVLAAETDAIDLNAAARGRAKLVAELTAAAIAANTKAGEENTAVTAEQTARINEAADAYEKVALKAEAAHSPLQQFARDGANVSKAMQEASVSGLRGFEDALIDIGSQTKTAKQAFHDMTEAILKDIARLLIRQAITGPLAGILGGFLGFSQGGPVGGPRLPGFAPGGFVSGPGTGTSDSIPARLSDGEFVVRAPQASANRDLLEAINSGRGAQQQPAAQAMTIVVKAGPRTDQSVRDLIHDIKRVSRDMPVRLKLV